MSAKTLKVRLVGNDEDDGIVRFDDFRNFCDNLAKCLRKSESLVSTKPASIGYRLASLETASASVTLEALPPMNGRDYRDEVLSLFRDTVSNLEGGMPVDPRVDRDALEAFRDLVTPLHRSTKEVWIENSRLTAHFEASIQRILGASIASEGAVSGILEGINVHNRTEFVLYPPIPGNRIRCSFPEELFDAVIHAIRRNVTVWGTLYHDKDKAFPHMVQVKRMETHPRDTDLPTLESLKGLAPGCTGGIESVAYVRSMRDD